MIGCIKRLGVPSKKERISEPQVPSIAALLPMLLEGSCLSSPHVDSGIIMLPVTGLKVVFFSYEIT